jgi:hypothetical protein
MKYNFKEYEIQDYTSVGPMRRRYDTYEETYKGYGIHRYIRGEYTRYSVDDEHDDILVETDNIVMLYY